MWIVFDMSVCVCMCDVRLGHMVSARVMRIYFDCICVWVHVAKPGKKTFFFFEYNEKELCEWKVLVDITRNDTSRINVCVCAGLLCEWHKRMLETTINTCFVVFFDAENMQIARLIESNAA